MSKSVILLGKGSLAIRIAEWFRQSDLYDLQLVVPVMPEPGWTESITDWCHTNDIDCLAGGHYRDIPDVQRDGWSADLAFSVFYDKILPAWFIRKFKRILNLHNAPLPRYRGVSPINWALKNNETSHGVTIHEITPGIDDGPIVAQLSYSIYPEFDEVIDVYRRALEYGYLLFEQTMPNLDRIEARGQDHDQASYYSKRDDIRLDERRNFTRELSVST